MEAGAALYLAAKKGDAARVRALFVSGADLHAKPVRYHASRRACLRSFPCMQAAAPPISCAAQPLTHGCGRRTR
jgi:hypothetical protein